MSRRALRPPMILWIRAVHSIVLNNSESMTELTLERLWRGSSRIYREATTSHASLQVTCCLGGGQGSAACYMATASANVGLVQPRFRLFITFLMDQTSHGWNLLCRRSPEPLMQAHQLGLHVRAA